MFGIPARQLLTAEPLNDYVARGMFGTDPRSAIDPSVAGLVERVAGVHVPGSEGCQVGMRLSGEVSSEVAATLHGLGVRRFAVDGPEVRPLLLALGRSALDR